MRFDIKHLYKRNGHQATQSIEKLHAGEKGRLCGLGRKASVLDVEKRRTQEALMEGIPQEWPRHGYSGGTHPHLCFMLMGALVMKVASYVRFCLLIDTKS